MNKYLFISQKLYGGKIMRNERELKLFDDEDFDFFSPFENLFRVPAFRHEPNFDHLMRTDIKENETNYQLEMELAGVSKENVDIQLKNGYLTVSAHHNSSNEQKDKTGNYIRRERSFGKSSRSFYVGEHIKENDIDAKLEHGILTITVPKKSPEVERSQKIEIK